MPRSSPSRWPRRPHRVDPALSDGSAAVVGTADLASLADLLSTDPEQARRTAITAAATAAGEQLVSLLEVAAEASVRVGAVADACALFESAALAAAGAGDARAGSLAVRHAAMVAATGDSTAALLALDEAEKLLGEDAWRAWYQRGLILHWTGRSEEALHWLHRAEPRAVDVGDLLTVAKLKMNRALAHAHLGDLAAAAHDGEEAEAACAALGERTLAAQARHNRGWIAAQAGQLAAGWRLMHDAAQDSAWVAPPVVLADRAELADAAGLLTEADELAGDAWAAQQASGDDHGAAATQLLRAKIALDRGHLDRAEQLAALATSELVAQGRSVLASAGAAVRIEAVRERLQRAGHLGPDAAVTAAADLRPTLELVERHPWRSVRIEGLIAAGEVHALAGLDSEARRYFGAAAGESAPEDDLRHHVAAAFFAAADGRPDAGSLELAWATLDARRQIPMAEELRGDWGSAVRLLTRAALVPALQQGDGEGAVRWLERLRAPFVVSAPDEDVAVITRSLRALARRRRTAAFHLDEGEMSSLDDEEAVLEGRLVDRARTLVAQPSGQPRVEDVDLAAAAEDTTLVWVVALPAGVWVVTVTGGATAVRRVDHDGLVGDVLRLRSDVGLGREEWRATAGSVDDALGAAGWGPKPVVIAVGSAVEDVPWGALPSLRDLPVRECWSGAHWLNTRRRRPIGSVTVIAGDVEGAATEAELLRGVWPAAQVVTGSAATAARVLAALAHDDLVHVAAHGHLRRDNPMLSALQCADGPLYGYELARLPRVASTVVLWACGLGGARMPGDVGAAGWSTLLAARGCDALVASCSALPTGPAPELAAELHRGLARGEDAGVVLAGLRTHAAGEDTSFRAAAMLAVHGGG
ncbi:MAG: hypothetical protein QOJ67_1020 [Acidimicrobiaceae bacterium]